MQADEWQPFSSKSIGSMRFVRNFGSGVEFVNPIYDTSEMNRL
jgi:hypothetical protein